MKLWNTMIGTALALMATQIAPAQVHDGRLDASGDVQSNQVRAEVRQSYEDNNGSDPVATWRSVPAPAPIFAGEAPDRTASVSHLPTVDEWLSDLDGRISRQETAFAYTVRRARELAIIVLAVIGACIAYLLIRQHQLSVNTAVTPESREQNPHAKRQSGLITSSSDSFAAVRPKGSLRPATRHSLSSELPRVRLLSGVLERLATGINESRRHRGTVETGYALVGKVVGSGTSRTILVSGLVDEGPSSDRSGGHHQADRSYQQKELELLQLVDGEVMFIGDAHLHPGNLDRCSGGDYRTDSANVRASHTQEMVFAIATAESAHWGGRSPSSLYYQGLKFDFFYLGQASNYEYRHCEPEIVDGAALDVPLELRRFAMADSMRARLDFENLRRLAHYRMALTALPDPDGASRPCIVMRHKSKGFSALIAFSADPHKCPEVFVEVGSELREFRPAYLNGGWVGGVVWFTPIVLDIEREMSACQSNGVGSTSRPRSCERSAHAGARTSGPIGVSHGKLHAIEQRTCRGNSEGDGPLSVEQ